MKKFLLAFIAFVGLNAASHAQATPAQKKATPAQTVVKVDTKQTTTTKAVTPATAKPKAAAPIKADGTPDMRFKANKGGSKVAAKGKLKKDGTPDLRYKANKKK